MNCNDQLGFSMTPSSDTNFDTASFLMATSFCGFGRAEPAAAPISAIHQSAIQVADRRLGGAARGSLVAGCKEAKMLIGEWVYLEFRHFQEIVITRGGRAEEIMVLEFILEHALGR